MILKSQVVVRDRVRINHLKNQLMLVQTMPQAKTALGVHQSGKYLVSNEAELTLSI